MVLIDLHKAFDTIDHNILLLKIASLTFLREVIDCYKSYLSSTKFHVYLHDKLLSSANLQCGVTQGPFWTFVISVVYGEITVFYAVNMVTQNQAILKSNIFRL